MSDPNWKSLVETLIFVSGRALGVKEILEVIPNLTRDILLQILAELEQEWSSRNGGIELVKVAEGYEFRTRPEYAPWIKALQKTKIQKLSQPAIETLSFIAYRQPVTRAEIESVRGVDSGAVLKSLGDRHLIKVVGRKEEPGRPLLYATTTEFLEIFGLKDLSDLPPLSELQETLKSASETMSSMELSLVEGTPELELEAQPLDDKDQEVLQELEKSLENLKKWENSTSWEK